MWAALEQIALRDQIVDAVAKIAALVPDEAGADGAMREQITPRFRTVAPFLQQLAGTIPWGATAAGQPVLDALAALEGLRRRRKLLQKEI